MEVLFITDTHIGGRRSCHHTMRQQLKFYQNQLIPLLKEMNIKTIVHFGDVFCVRRATDHAILHEYKKLVFDVIRDMGIMIDIIPGNHDIYYNTTSEVNTISLLLGEYANITVIDTPTVISYGNIPVQLMPWVNYSNSAEFMDIVDSPNSKMMFGHFDIQGIIQGDRKERNLSQSTFKKFTKVVSGHFHKKSLTNNIQYLGSPFQMYWSDAEADYGVHIWNTNNDPFCEDLEFIKNNHNLHTIVEYKDEIIYDELCGRIVRILVNEEYDVNELEEFISRVHQCDVFKLEVVDNTHYDIIDVVIEDKNSDGISEYSKVYIEMLECEVDKEELLDGFLSRYRSGE